MGIAEAHGVSVAQVIIRWLIQRGVALVAKSTHAERLRANSTSSVSPCPRRR